MDSYVQLSVYLKSYTKYTYISATKSKYHVFKAKSIVL